MMIQIYCTDDEYKNIIKPLGEISSIRIIKDFKTAKEGRLKFIKNNLKFNKTLEFNYRSNCIKGYSFSRKTFQRDITALEQLGFLIKEVSRGGYNGSTTIIRPSIIKT